MSEFIGNDFGILKNHTSTTATTGPSAGKNILEILLHNVNPRNYDLEYSLRHILHHRGAAVELYENIHNNNNRMNQNNNRQSTRSTSCSNSKFIFTQPKINQWGRRPPNFIGGGLSMTLMNNRLQNNDNNTTDDFAAPWPYSKSDATTDPNPYHPSNYLQNWFTFQPSSTYTAKINKYDTYISTTHPILIP